MLKNISMIFKLHSNEKNKLIDEFSYLAKPTLELHVRLFKELR